MPRRTYVTVPTELQEAADAVADFLEDRGYSIDVEARDVSFPYTPTLRATQRTTTVFVEVAATIQSAIVRRWHGFGRSCSSDTRITIALPNSAKRPARAVDELTRLKVGMLVVDGASVTEVLNAHDLAMNFELPDVRRAPKRLKELIGPAHEKIARGDWREGFGDACAALEDEAAKHMKRGVASGRIAVLTDKGNVRSLTATQIDRMTLGQLEKAFARIRNPNYVDTLLVGALGRILDDRNALTHARTKTKTEDSLRRNVGQHLWTIDGALRALLKATRQP